MKINFLTYANVPNPNGIPSAWPAQVVAALDTDPAPPAPWQQMTASDYNAYVASNQASYDAWVNSQTSSRQSTVTTLEGQYDTAISGMQTFAGIGSPTQAQTLSVVQLHNQVLLKLFPILRAQYAQSIEDH